MSEAQQPPPEPRGKGLHFDGSININTLLSLIIAGVMAMLWFTGGRSENAQTAGEVRHLGDRVTTEVTRLTRAIDQLSQAVTPVATMATRLDQLERRVNEGEARDRQQDEQLGRHGGELIQLRTQVEPLVRASGIPLPGSPGVGRR